MHRKILLSLLCAAAVLPARRASVLATLYLVFNQRAGAAGDGKRRRRLDALDAPGKADGHGEYRMAANPAKVREGILRCNSGRS